MATATQTSRLFQLKTPLGKDVLLLERMTGSEALGRPFEWDLELLSERFDIEADRLLGQKVSLALTLPGGGKRYFHGYVTEFGQEGWVQRYHRYHAVVRPWFWLLTRTADCRIFQDLTAPQIFEQVVKQCGFTDYRLKLSGTYAAREFCVQYRETDFDFLSRLLEEEGIYYYFEHAESAHTLVLADDPSGHETPAGYDKVPFRPAGGPAARAERDPLEAWSDWTYTKSVRTGTFATADYDFEKPRLALTASESISRPHEQSHFEVFDYPAEPDQLTPAQAAQVAKVRIQELQAGYMVARGRGNAAGLAAGCRFTLDKHPHKDLNVEYLITRATYALASDAYETGEAASSPEALLVSVEAIEAKTHFRPERLTPRPVIRGAQTAVVVGPAGEEIYTDKYGRVKLQFPWDRQGKQDEKSSCWVRVAQLWAGKGWGGIHTPRIGQEVIVSFLEGDPDRPIVTGRVYNGDAMPPYALPGNATQSGIRSRSSKGGGDANFNEIRFEDLKGSEQLSVQAEKDYQLVVKHDETHSVNHDRTKAVKHDETVKVDHDRTETVGHDETVSIGADRTHKVSGNEKLEVSGKRTVSVDQDDSAKIGKGLVIDAGESVTIKTGSASISMKSDGTIAIKGADITIEGSGKVTVKASGNLVMKGSKIQQN
jgi:type VI secretion system secreted protein VgrG